jgi:hypothetical protein
MDLPNGAGKYRVKAAFSDTTYGQVLGWRFFDGDSGVEIAAAKNGGTSTSYYQTILGNSPAHSDFDATKEDYIEHEFVSDHILVFRDTYMQSGNSMISSLWVEPVTAGLGDEKLWLCPSINDSANDISGNENHGTYNGGMGTVTSDGKLAYDFDGTDDFIDCGSSTGIGQSSTFSVSAWFSADAFSSSAGLVTAYGNVSPYSNQRGWMIRMPSSPTFLTNAAKSSSSFNSTITSSQSLSTNTWHHIVATYDVSTGAMEMFIDGVSVATGSSAGTISSPTVPFRIGKYDSNEFNGKADDVRAYNRVLTQEEITHLASSRGIQGSPFGKGLGGESLWICPTITNTKEDISGHNITATLNGGMSIVSDTNNGGSKCFEFDGSNDYISTDMQGEASFFSKTGKWSVAAWVKFDDGSSTASHGIIGTSVGSSGYGFNLWMSSLAEGLRGDVADGSYLCYPSEGSAWPDSGWHHVAFVSDGTTATLYRDGASVATQALASLNTAWVQPVSYPVLFGAYTSGGSLAGVMDGRMDDIRIFRRPLSQAELTKLASQRGVLGKANPDGLGDEAFWCSPTHTGTVADISNNGQAYLGGKQQAKFLGNAEIVSSTGSGGTDAFEFGGGSERVRLDQKIGFRKDKNYSLSFWAKPSAVSALRIFVAKMETSGQYTGWNIQHSSGGSVVFEALRNGTTSARVRAETPSGVVSNNTWAHIAVTWDGYDSTTFQIFVDGVKQTLTHTYNNWGTNQNMYTHEEFVIGGRGGHSAYAYLGQVDDIRGYARVLDEAEIAHLSTSRSVTGKPPKQTQVINEAVAYVPMQEQGTTFYCQKTNIAGTLSDTNSTGRHVAGPTEFLSNAVKFDASRQRRIAFASVPSGLAGMTKYTVSAWVKAQISSTTNRCVVSFEGTASSRSYRLDTHVSASTLKGPSFFHANSQILNRNKLDNTNQWTHVTVTVDTTTGTRQSYIDGQLDVESAGSPYAAVHATLNYFAIGATTHGGVGNYHDAAIAGVGIWDKILSPTEINSLYSGYGRKLKGLRDEKLWIVPSRTGDRSNVMYPAHADTELNGSLSIIDDVDEGGTKAIQFNDQSSTSNYLEWDDNTDSDPVTVAFWVKAPAYSTYDMTALIGKSGSGSLRALLDTSGYGMGGTLSFSGDSNPYAGTAWFNTNFGSATWHHVAMVRDYQSSTKFYVDGTLVHTGSADDTTAGDWDAAEYFIGIDKSTNYSDNNLYADIDDLRVIDGAATSDEIAHIAQFRGILGGPYIECDAGEFNVTGNNVNLRIPVRMSASAATFTLTGQVAHGNWIPAGLGTELMWVCPTYTGDRSNLAPSQNATSNGGTLSVINDTTNQGLRAFDCTVTNNANNYWRFNYGSSRPGTLTFWMKKSSTGNWWQTMARRVTSGNAVQIQVRSSTNSNTNFDYFYYWNDNQGSNQTTTLNGTWHHVVMERDRGGLNRFFVDGVAYGSYTGGAGSASDEFAGTMQFIASSSSSHTSGAYNFTGLIDDIRLFDTQLTSAEIAHLASRRGVQGPASTSASMSADVVTFTLAGQAVAFRQGIKLSAGISAFSLSVASADLDIELNGSAQSYLLSSQGTDLDIELNTTAGSFTLTAATQVLDVELNTAVGAFSLSGTAAELSVAQSIPASAGSFVLTGVPTDDLAIELNTSVGTFAATGTAAELSVSKAMPASAGSFALTGTETDDLAIELNADVESFALTGVSANLQTSNAKQLGADAAAFAVTPQNTTRFLVEFNQTVGSLAVSGVNAPLDIATVASAVSFSVASQSAFLGLTFQLTVGTFQVTGTSLPPIPGTQRPNPYYYRFLMQDE